jgi:hypothetical protein
MDRQEGPTPHRSGLQIPAWVFAAALVATFGICLIAAGHGVAPIAFIMVFGWEAWLAPVAAGWLGIAVLLLGLMRARRSGHGVLYMGAALMLVSWTLFVTRSEFIAATLVYSAPFLGTLGFWLVHTARPRRAD